MNEIYDHRYADFEGNFQLVSEHTDGVDPVVNTVLKTGNGKVCIHFKGDEFRKTNETGNEVGMLIEVYELANATSGGVPYSNTFSVNKNRKVGGEGVEYSVVEDDGSLIVDETGAEIILRERGFATKSQVDRSLDLDLKYELKPNSEYLFKSTVITGNSDSSENTLLGEIWEVRDE